MSNKSAITMYEKMGYSIYRRVLGYYSGEEDAFDMRKVREAQGHEPPSSSSSSSPPNDMINDGWQHATR